MNKYTKVSDKMADKFTWNIAGVYSKLCFRMKLSYKNPNKYYDDGYFIIYRIDDLAHDAHVGRNTTINALKKLESSGYVAKVHTMYGQRLYLPKFNSKRQSTKSSVTKVKKVNHESLKSKRPREQRVNNKDLQSKSVNRSFVKRQKSEKYPKITEIIKKYSKPLVHYAVGIYHNTTEFHKVNNPCHFVIGVLRRWEHKGIKTVNDAMLSEHDSRAKLPAGPKIPIFRL